MPTGITASLENKNYDVKQWMKEDIARQFGICISLRDSGALTEEKIREELIKGFDTSYHEKRIEEARETLAKVSDPSYDFEGELNEMKVKAQEKYEERLKEFNLKKEAHVKAMGEINNLKSKVNSSHSELITNAVDLAKDQLLKAFEFDYGRGPYRDSILDVSLDEWKEAQLRLAEESIEYHKEKLAGQNKANEERLAAYDEYINFINKNL